MIIETSKIFSEPYRQPFFSQSLERLPDPIFSPLFLFLSMRRFWQEQLRYPVDVVDLRRVTAQTNLEH